MLRDGSGFLWQGQVDAAMATLDDADSGPLNASVVIWSGIENGFPTIVTIRKKGGRLARAMSSPG
jgi:hypothetical protein